MTFIVRPTVSTDREQWLPLWDGYNVFYGRKGKLALDPHVTAATWARFFDEGAPVHAFVAESQGRLIGIAHCLYHLSTTSIAPVCYMQDLFTAPEARGKGVGTALIRAVYDHARASGVSRLYWHTHETNTKAQKVYDRLAERSGFIVYRYLPRT